MVLASLLLPEYGIFRGRPLQEKKTEWQFELSWGGGGGTADV